MMAAAILDSHQNTDNTTVVVLPDARGIAKHATVWLPREGASATCAPPGVVSYLNYGETRRRSFTLIYPSMIYIAGKHVSVETRVPLLIVPLSPISDHATVFVNFGKKPVLVSHKQNRQSGPYVLTF